VRLTGIKTRDYGTIIHARKTLEMRGAPLIGIAAAYAAVLAAQEGASAGSDNIVTWMESALTEIASARPTAKNLAFAVNRMRRILHENSDAEGSVLKDLFLLEARNIDDEDRMMCDKIGAFGAELLHDGDGIITHCNTGMLVTGGIGTALGIIFTAARQGKRVRVYADETRPLLQGARLTTWECVRENIPVTLICDGAAAAVMKKGSVQCAIVGADRIAANGDTANKIGTYSLAVNCSAHRIPFYVAAPYSTFDLSIKSGMDIPIEERCAGEITHIQGNRIAPGGISVYNPAFDITPASLISAIITDAGVFTPPYERWKNLGENSSLRHF